MSSKRIAINTLATYGRSVLAMGMALFSSLLQCRGQLKPIFTRHLTGQSNSIPHPDTPNFYMRGKSKCMYRMEMNELVIVDFFLEGNIG